MNEALRHEIVQQHQAGMSARAIARQLGISRRTVGRVLAQVELARHQDASSTLPPRLRRRPSLVDDYEPILKELLDRYPNMTAQRVFEELRTRGFTGKYTIVRQRVRHLRQRPAHTPVIRFETGPGKQAQMDYGTYDIDFTREGRRRVYLFSYLSSYSRRQYLRFVEAMDLHTTLREHIRAFTHLGGVAATCLYDNFKVVVLRHDADGPLYNPKFLAFATHYGFRPWACQPRRPQTKGKVERRFQFAETSLLNGRTFDTLDHLNEVTAWWLHNVADVHPLRDTKETPRERHQREQPQLLPLPASAYDTALLVYRHVQADGFVAYRQNFYSVPWCHIGQIVPVRVTENEVIIYTPTLEVIVRHPLASRESSSVRVQLSSHHPSSDPHQHASLLRTRFLQLGPNAARFFEGLLARHTQGRHQAQQVLALLGHYGRADVCAALERAVRFGAFTASSVARILSATAKPRTILDALAEHQRDLLDPSLCVDPIAPRPTREYQSLLLPEEPDHEKTPCATPPDAKDAEPDAGLGQPHGPA